MAIRRRHRSRARAIVGIAAAAAAVGVTPAARGQTSLTGGTLALKSAGSATLSGTGYVGTYLTVPASGATVNFTVNAAAGSTGTGTPHLQIVVADTTQGFNAAATSATNYTTGNIVLPGGTYAVRSERDYVGNAGVTKSLTVNNLSVNTVSGSGSATFTNSSSDTNARVAADTYIANFRKTDATVALTGPASIPLLPGTPVHVDLARHAFNFGSEVPGNTPSDVTSYLGTSGTSQQTNYQQRLNQNYNAIVPGNAGKWGNNEYTRDVNTMSGVDTVLNYATSHNMRVRMHNLIWGDNTYNGQQPPWVLNGSGTGLLDQAAAGNATAAADLRTEISERIGYYINSTRAPKIAELDVYNESLHTPTYRTAYGYSGVGSIYTEAANAAAAAGASTKMFTNEYNIFQDGTDAYANWYASEIQSIRNAGGAVGGIGMQYYPNTTIGTANNQHSAARMMAVLNNLSVQGLPIALTEFGVKSGGEAISPTVLDDSMRLVFGSPNATGFMMWGFWAGEGLFAPGSAMYDANWNLTDTGKNWQDLLGIQDWDGNPNNAWDTDQNVVVDASGTVHITGGFLGDYYLSGQLPNRLGAKLLPFDLTLKKGTSAYSTGLAKPPDWFFWKTNGSGTWTTSGNWTDAPQSGATPSGAGKTAYFGSSATTYDTGNSATAGAATTVNIINNVTVTIPAAVTLGMVVFDNPTARYTLSGSAITLQGYNIASGHRAAIFVNRGSHTINAPLNLADDTTVTIPSLGNTLTVSDLQKTGAAVTKAGAGTLQVDQLDAGSVAVTGGVLQLLPGGGAMGAGRAATIAVSPGAALDLSDHKFVTRSPTGAWNGSAYTGVTGLIAAGRHDGAWDGSGIVTRTAAAGDYTTLGVARSADVTGVTAGTVIWQGQTVSPGDTLILFTYGGDANLDGVIDIDDYTQIDSSMSAGGTLKGWSNGDFNYDGSIDIDDYTIIDSNIGIQGTGLAAAAPLRGFANPAVAAVPEPAHLVMVFVITASVAAARRRRGAVKASGSTIA